MSSDLTPPLAERLLNLLPSESRRSVPDLYATEGESDPIVRAKLFTPWACWTWYVIEFDGDDECFGLVQGFEEELGSFSLRELASITGPGGVTIERDPGFEQVPVSKVRGASAASAELSHDPGGPSP